MFFTPYGGRDLVRIVAALERGHTSWTRMPGALRLGPDDDITAVTTTPLRVVVERLIAAGHRTPGDPPIEIVMDSPPGTTSPDWRSPIGWPLASPTAWTTPGNHPPHPDQAARQALPTNTQPPAITAASPPNAPPASNNTIRPPPPQVKHQAQQIQRLRRAVATDAARS